MIDFTWTEATIWTTLVSILIYCFFCIHYRNVLLFDYEEMPINKTLFFCAFFLVVFVCIDGDWFHYQQMVSNYDFTAGATNYGETIYGSIVYLVNRNYLLFRTIVWGLALLLFTLTAKRLELNVNTAIYFLIVVFLLRFNYARASLGFACFFYGISYLIIPHNKKNIGFAICALFIWLSTLFHTSCAVLIPFIVAIYLPINKYTIISAVLLIPIMGLIIRDFLPVFIGSDAVANNEYLLGKMEGYTNQVTNQSNIAGIVGNIIGYTPLFLPIIMSFYKYNEYSDSFSVVTVKLLKLSVCIVLFSISFLFVGLDTNLFFYRFLFMSFVPTVLLTVGLYKEGFFIQREFNILLFVGFISIIFRMLLILYKIDNGTYYVD